MEQAPATPRSTLVGRDSFNTEYAPLKWRTVLGWAKGGRVKVIRIGRKCFLIRAEIDQILAEGTHQVANGWRRERAP